MKIIRKPVKAIVECPLCECEFVIKGKDWRTIERSKPSGEHPYYVRCPNCFHYKSIIPGEVKCKK